MTYSTRSLFSFVQLKSLPLPKKTRYLNDTLITRRCIAYSSLSMKNNCSNSIIVIDNYDSFTYNLCQVLLPLFAPFVLNFSIWSLASHQHLCIGFWLILVFNLKYIGELGCKFEVYRNDEITVDQVRRWYEIRDENSWYDMKIFNFLGCHL